PLGRDGSSIQIEARRTAQAKRGEGGIGARRAAGKRRRATCFAEATGMQVHIGKVGEWLEARRPEIEPIGKLAEDLCRTSVIISPEAFAEAGEGNAAAGRDVVPSVG